MRDKPEEQLSQRVNNLSYMLLQAVRDKRWIPVSFGFIVIACFSILADRLPPDAEVAVVSVIHIGLCIVSFVSFISMITTR